MSILDRVLRLIAWATLALAAEIEKPFPRLSAKLCGLSAHVLARLASPEARRLHANALVREGVAWAGAGDSAKSLALNDRVIDSCRQSTDRDVLVSVAWAMVNKGHGLSEVGRTDDATAIYRDLTELVPMEEPFVDPLSQGLMNWAIALDSANRHDEEKELYDRIQTLLGKATDLRLQARLAWSIVNKGMTLVHEERYAESIDLFDVVNRRWWQPMSIETPMALHEALAAAGRYRSRALVMLGRYTEAIEGSERILERYANTRDHGIEEEVAWAALTKASAEERLGRISDAQRTCNFVEARYRRSQPEQVSIARRESARMRATVE